MAGNVIVIKKNWRLRRSFVQYVGISFLAIPVGSILVWGGLQIEFGLPTGLISLAGGSGLVGTGVLTLWWGMSLRVPAHVRIDDEKVQYFVRDALREEIWLDKSASITPYFNNFVGRNGFYGFRISTSSASISMSPETGWSLDELYDSLDTVLTFCGTESATFLPDSVTSLGDDLKSVDLG